ncbi:helix-turn-helix transcriptional regulator [Nonomuraea sp. NPDC050556]|uniref:helix-turn-helix transcriptional regulator n=1 Tax=Nonomuraea sp. NPDC050556 TaxID=3364369 RepID=UPI00379937B7
MLQLLSLLQSRRTWAGPELAARLEITVRTLRRDIERLRELGYPVVGTTGTAGGYRLGAGASLPPLLLDDEEAVAVAVGLRASADEASLRALGKLEQVLPVRLRHRVHAVSSAISARPGPSADHSALALLSVAIRDAELVSFSYQSREGEPSSRRAEPYRLVTSHGLWYLLAYDLHREGWRTYRVDRMTDLSLAQRRFPVRDDVPEASDYVAAGLAAAPYRYVAYAVVEAPAEVVLARLVDALPGRVEKIDDRTCRLRLGADTLPPIARDLASLGAPFTLEDAPVALRSHLQSLAQALLTATL